MTVKEFMESTTGVDEYDIEERGVYTIYHPVETEKAIAEYGERKIVSIYFSVSGYYQNKCVEIEIE
jgi:hypothetical protein